MPESLTAGELAGGPPETSDEWFAFVVKPNHEKAVFEHLKTLECEASLPLYRTRRRWSDRFKEVQLPLFPCYVFCRIAFRDRVGTLRVPGVRSIVTAGPNPAPIPPEEIAALETMVRSGLPIQPWPFLKTGQRVRVSSGPLRGVEGILVQFRKTWQVVVSVELLQRSVSAEVDREFVSPLS